MWIKNHRCNWRKVEVISARFLTQQQKRNLQVPLKCYIKFDEKTAWCRSFPLRAVYSLRKFHSCGRDPDSGAVWKCSRFKNERLFKWCQSFRLDVLLGRRK